MAKIVIAGAADCPYYAKAELLADSLQKNLPDFKLHKIVKNPTEWDNWLSDICQLRGFRHRKSPIVWRELVDRGGKGLLIGGANEFQEYVHGYYDLKSVLTSDDMSRMSGENLQTNAEIEAEEREFRERIKPLHVCITHASNPTCYMMMEALAKGEALGDKTDISIRLLDTEDKVAGLEGLKMEVTDLACPLLHGVEIVTDPAVAFADCSVIVLLDEIAREEKERDEEEEEKKKEAEKKKKKKKKGKDKEEEPEEDPEARFSESREDWLKRNHEHYVKYAQIINEKAKRDVKVIIGGRGPVNFNTYMMLQHMPDIPRQNVVGMSRMIENNAKAVIAERLGVNSAGVVDVIAWGHSYRETYIDISQARVHHYDGAVWGPPSFSLPVTEMVHDEKWVLTEFPGLVRHRRDLIETSIRHATSASHAAAAVSLLQHWWGGSPQGQIFSLAVQSEGWYGVPDGLVFSYPVTFNPSGYWVVVQDMDLTEEATTNIENVVKELVSEKEVIYPPPYVPPPTPPPEEAEQKSSDTQVAEGEDGLVDSSSLGRITEDPDGEAIAASEVVAPKSSSTEPPEEASQTTAPSEEPSATSEEPTATDS